MFVLGVGVGVLVLPTIGMVYLTYDYLTRRGMIITCLCSKKYGYRGTVVEDDPNVPDDLVSYTSKESLDVITEIRAKFHFWFKCPARR